MEAGATVVVIDYDAVLLETVKESHPSVETHQVDLSNWEETKKILENVGCVHHLVNNAGIGRPAEKFLDMKPDSIDQ